MPEHLHVLLTPLPNQTIERCAQCIKGGFSHEVRAQFGGEVWQHGFHEHRIRDGEDFRRQFEYIAANPQRRGLVDHLFVHTRFLDRLDDLPARFELRAGTGRPGLVGRGFNPDIESAPKGRAFRP